MGIRDYDMPQKFELFGEAAYQLDPGNGLARPLTAAHLAAQARAANWLTRRPVRWFEVPAVGTNTLFTGFPPAGARGGMILRHDRWTLPYGRLVVPKMPGYNQARLRVHTRHATVNRLGVRMTVKTGARPEAVRTYQLNPAVTDNWMEVVVPVDPGTEEWIEIGFQGRTYELMDVTGTIGTSAYGYAGTASFVVTQAIPGGPGQTSATVNPDTGLEVYHTTAPSIGAWSPHTVSRDGHRIEFKNAFGDLLVERQIASNFNYAGNVGFTATKVNFDPPIQGEEADQLMVNVNNGTVTASVYECPRLEVACVQAILQYDGES